ncbi:hypothetical protein V8F06_009882 [Rhypophila decipiens]
MAHYIMHEVWPGAILWSPGLGESRKRNEASYDEHLFMNQHSLIVIAMECTYKYASKNRIISFNQVHTLLVSQARHTRLASYNQLPRLLLEVIPQSHPPVIMCSSTSLHGNAKAADESSFIGKQSSKFTNASSTGSQSSATTLSSKAYPVSPKASHKKKRIAKDSKKNIIVSNLAGVGSQFAADESIVMNPPAAILDSDCY